jgi:hypothetical protein
VTTARVTNRDPSLRNRVFAARLADEQPDGTFLPNTAILPVGHFAWSIGSITGGDETHAALAELRNNFVVRKRGAQSRARHCFVIMTQAPT